MTGNNILNWKQFVRLLGWPGFYFGLAMVAMAAATYFGNLFIGISQGMVALCMIALIVTRIKAKSEEGDEVQSGLYQSPFRTWRASSWCLLGFFFFALISIFATTAELESPISHLRGLRYFIIVFLILTIPFTRNFLNSRKIWVKAMAIAWLVSVGVATVSGLIGNFTGFNPILMEAPAKPGQASGLYGQPMTYAYSMQCSFLILLAWSLTVLKGEKRPLGINRLVIWGITCVSGAGILFSDARGAMLGVAVGGMAMVWLFSRKLALIVIATALIGGGAYILGTKAEPGISVSDSRRLSQWKTASLAFVKHPIFGVGFDNFERRCADLKVEFHIPFDKFVVKVEDGKRKRVWFHLKGHAHNNYLSAFASTGVFGGLSFMAFLGFWGLESLRSRNARLFVFPSIVAIAISGTFENTFSDSEVLSFYPVSYTHLTLPTKRIV